MKWSDILSDDTKKLGVALQHRAIEEIKQGNRICPSPENILNALRFTAPERIKACIVGQDPYHTPGQANGLAFSITQGHPMQPSLRNIFNELTSDIECPFPQTTDLTKWAKRGVLLLNTTLTVYEGKANSHVGWGWNKFTTEVLRAVTRLPQPVVFMLWGANAQALLKDLISVASIYERPHIIRENLIKKAYILSSHPSPLSVSKPCKNTPAFKSSKPFSTTNRILVEMGGEPIEWSL